MRFFLLTLSLVMGLCCSFEVFGQNAVQKESVSFSIPKTLYFTGEKIWIDAEVLLGAGSSTSQVLYAELVDAESNSVDYVKMPLVRGKALNYFKIKQSIPSANYLLRVYTRISPYLNLEQGIAQQFITVINPNIPPKPAEKKTSALSPSRLSLQKSTVIGANIPQQNGEIQAMGFSIANPFLTEEHQAISSTEAYKGIEKRTLYPELFGHIVEVKVPNPEENSTYFLSVHGKQSALYTDIADENGTLIFDIGGLKNWDRMIIQLENGAEMPGIQVVSPVIRTQFKDSFTFPELTLHTSDLELLEKLIKASMVESYYKEIYGLDTVEIVTGFVADYSYNLDDYTRFEDIETVLREYVPSVQVRTRERKKEFRLLDEANKKVFEANPLILVDAMPVFDSDLLSSFNPKFMSKLEVLNREFYLNERTYPGVLSWSSYENNFGLYPLAPSARFFDYLGLQPLVEMDRNQFANPAKEEKFPDWRTILYWNSTASGFNQIQTPALDGVFVLWVKTQDAQGKTQVARTYYSILP